MIAAPKSRSWDVFCRVVDNFGDAAVCWRLASQLAAEHGARVRLWIDRLEPLQALCPEVSADRPAQSVASVEIRLWTNDAQFGTPAEIVVDAFGSGLPDAYVAAMARRIPPSLWIILEYLSAERWVGTHHRLPSPHPTLPLPRHFFFPGLVPETGGVLKEASLEPRRDAFQRDPGRHAGLWRELGFAPPERGSLVVSLFGYGNPAVEELLRAWSDGSQPIVAVVPPGILAGQVAALFGAAQADAGATLVRGGLEVRLTAFMPQPRYDELLWACDWNFVRGEDSFVRAQWAMRPLVWHIYPQPGAAHQIKLEAFLEIYCAGLEPPPEQALRALWRAWNAQATSAGTLGDAWHAAVRHQVRLREHSHAWALRLALPGDLAGNLAQFCEDRLK